MVRNHVVCQKSSKSFATVGKATDTIVVSRKLNKSPPKVEPTSKTLRQPCTSIAAGLDGFSFSVDGSDSESKDNMNSGGGGRDIRVGSPLSRSIIEARGSSATD